jgi:hypothetical protein
MKAMNEQGIKQLTQRMELDYLADRKLAPNKQQFRELENDLFFVLDEKGHTVHLTESGIDELSPGDHDEFALPDISTEIHRIDRDTEMSPAGEAGGAPHDRGGVRDEEREAPHRAPAPAGACPVRKGRQLRRAGRAGPHRRRVHRAHDARAALVGGAAPGGRSQGRGCR